jgi:nitroimidazol reductase NimA-like FMN-containing flavoprotein (pyridoxamine 5'-phosphate oxidase superfamily)
MATPMTTLTHEECLRALSTGSVGRVAITAQALPAIVPVNYTLDGRTIVFRTRTDGTLARACDSNVVAFEVDQLGNDHTGWSVLVVGVAALLSGSDALRAVQLNLASAAGEDRDQFVSIAIGRISGRRIGDIALSGGSGGSGASSVGGEEMLVASCP